MPRIFCFKIHRLCLSLVLLLSTIGCDQITKTIARVCLSFRSISYMGGFFRLQYIENPGGFLGIGSSLSPNARFWIFTVIVSLYLIGAARILIRKNDLNDLLTISLTLIAAGGVSNLIDRIAKGTVTDFMNFGIGWFRTGIFNVADVAIMIGVALFLISSFRHNQHDFMQR